MRKILKFIDQAFIVYMIPHNYLAGVTVGVVKGTIDTAMHGFEHLEKDLG